MAMTVLVAYDISDDGARARCAAMLQAVGDRVQRSVYVCIVNPDELDELRARISALIDPEKDVVNFYRQCIACWEGGVSIGASKSHATEPYWAVF